MSEVDLFAWIVQFRVFSSFPHSIRSIVTAPALNTNSTVNAIFCHEFSCRHANLIKAILADQ